MSKFITTYPIDVQAILEMLPKGSHAQDIKLTESKRAVEITWDNDNYRTPFTVPIAFPLDNLAGDLPQHVTLRNAPKPIEKKEVTTVATPATKATVDKPKKKR